MTALGRTLLVMAVACRSPDLASTDTTAWPDTATAEWIALAIGGRPVLPGTRVTVQTSAGNVGGYSGCNWYGLRRDSGRTLTEMTARGCRDDVQDQERRLTMLLPGAVRAVRRADTLTLLDSSASPVITLVRRQPTGATPAQLRGVSWRLVASTVRQINTDSVLVRFSADSVHGFAGCRNLSGTYVATVDRLRFTYLNMHPMDCDDDQARVSEEHLTTVFSETEHFAVRGETLAVTTFGGDTLRFRKHEQ